jgi:hypothetical protein
MYPFETKRKITSNIFQMQTDPLSRLNPTVSRNPRTVSADVTNIVHLPWTKCMFNAAFFFSQACVIARW